MSQVGGCFVVIAFQGSIEPHYYDHIRRTAEDGRSFVLLLTRKDLQTFVRQAIKGKVTESHIQDRYDAIVRKLS